MADSQMIIKPSLKILNVCDIKYWQMICSDVLFYDLSNEYRPKHYFPMTSEFLFRFKKIPTSFWNLSMALKILIFWYRIGRQPGDFVCNQSDNQEIL